MCGFDERACAKLGEALKYCPKLEEIDLEGGVDAIPSTTLTHAVNEIGDDGLKALMAFVEEEKPHLQLMTLYCVNCIVLNDCVTFDRLQHQQGGLHAPGASGAPGQAEPQGLGDCIMHGVCSP